MTIIILLILDNDDSNSTNNTNDNGNIINNDNNKHADNDDDNTSNPQDCMVCTETLDKGGGAGKVIFKPKLKAIYRSMYTYVHMYIDT